MEILDRTNNAAVVLLPKDKNLEPALTWLKAAGVKLPNFTGRCLHR